jgi:uncharacterized protein (DUF433 family)
MPDSTLRAWTKGQRGFRPLIHLDDPERKFLSFLNLVEAYVLCGIRTAHKIPMQKVRRALKFVRKRWPSRHPLADQLFESDGLNLFIQEAGKLISISSEGQTAMREIIQQYLRRVRRDAQGIPNRFYPFTRAEATEGPEVVAIDPEISFGRPIIAARGIRTSIVAERMRAGESVEALAKDYESSNEEIEEAIRVEWLAEAA